MGCHITNQATQENGLTEPDIENNNYTIETENAHKIKINESTTCQPMLKERNKKTTSQYLEHIEISDVLSHQLIPIQRSHSHQIMSAQNITCNQKGILKSSQVISQSVRTVQKRRVRFKSEHPKVKSKDKSRKQSSITIQMLEEIF
ncbi:hypothetical protein pb186bvf_002840 [Paramecium bursaria]